VEMLGMRNMEGAPVGVQVLAEVLFLEAAAVVLGVLLLQAIMPLPGQMAGL
jgi:hypothetical protein